MSKFTTTLKGLMALALGSFALGADAALPTVSDAPTDGQFADNTTWYTWLANDAKGYIVEDDSYKTASKNNYLITNATLPALSNQDAAMWCFVGDADSGYTIYNKKGTAAKKLGFKNPGGGNGQYAYVKLYDADELAADNTIITTFHIGTYGNDGVYFENFATKGGSGSSHVMLNDREVSGNHILALWTNCDSPAGYTGNKYILAQAFDVNNAELVQKKNEAKAIIEGIGVFYHSQTAYQNVVSEIEQAYTIAEVNNLVNRVMNALDKKMVHLTYAPRNGETTAKYLGVVGEGNTRVAKLLDEKGARTKWKLVRVTGQNRFRLINTASDTYIGTIKSNGETVTTGNYFEVEFKVNTATSGAIVLKYFNTQICLTIGESQIGSTTHQYALQWTADNASVRDDAANAWFVEPAGIEVPQALEDGYYVIRSNRALTGAPNSSYGSAFPGSLLGCYTPDREKARANATAADNGKTYSNGVHVRQFMTGMQTIWKIVRQSDGGYKIYSIMGLGENDEPLMGMTINAQNEVVITDNPTTLYFVNPTAYTGYTEEKRSPLPYGIAISSTPDAQESKCFHLLNTLTSIDNNVMTTEDYYIKANFESPSQEGGKTNQGAVFYIERVSTTDINNAIEAFKDYAANNRMFELLKNVLTDEEKAYALAEKPKDLTVNSVATAREYLNAGSQAASTRAFEMLDGKTVRFVNRMSSQYMYVPAGSTTLKGSNTDVNANLRHLWTVEVVDATMRQVKLKNYVDNTYIGVMGGQNAVLGVVDGSTDHPAGVYTMARYYSLDGKSFYMNLLGANGSKTHHAIHHATVDRNDLLVWTSVALASHWTMENAVADDVKNTEVTLNYDKENKVIVVSGAALEKTANFPEAYGVTLTPAAATAALDGETATPVEVAVPNDKITKDGETFKVDLSELNVTPSNYTLNFPVGYFTINNKLAPALSTAVTVSEPTGIKEVNAAEKGAEVIYDLQGRRVSKAGKGVYIINGVKTLVK